MLRFRDAEHVLNPSVRPLGRRWRAGDTFWVPPDQWHQVVADPDYKAVHVMPKEIRFDFST